MGSFSPELCRPRHRRMWRVLESLDPALLVQTRSFFGGGTRIALDLAEFRVSEDIDFLCPDDDGYLALRKSVTQASLGPLLREDLPLASEVRANRYAIRTFVEVDNEPIKLEFIAVAPSRVRHEPAFTGNFPVPVLDRPTCFSEKFIANADRWADTWIHNRDLIDLAFMVEGWGADAAREGFERAVDAYGKAVPNALEKALRGLSNNPPYFRKCMLNLAIDDTETLRDGMGSLRRLIGQKRPEGHPGR